MDKLLLLIVFVMLEVFFCIGFVGVVVDMLGCMYSVVSKQFYQLQDYVGIEFFIKCGLQLELIDEGCQLVEIVVCSMDEMCCIYMVIIGGGCVLVMVVVSFIFVCQWMILMIVCFNVDYLDIDVLICLMGFYGSCRFEGLVDLVVFWD